jgi:hypothetical protein
MASEPTAGSEAARIELLLHREGYEATRVWVERTLNIYRAAIEPGQHGSDSSYRRLFERSIGEFEAWLATHQQHASNQPTEVREDRGSAARRQSAPS